ncbi:MAG TPA: quinate 5-dehydrogenase [bacterium]|nr:quinate 5-dehydrogenase [bacterium]
MKRVVSVSLGSSKRDHRVEIEILGEPFVIERIGTDGDMERFEALVRELDGHVDAIGMGGIDLDLRAGRRRYRIRDAARLIRDVHRTPVVDGGGIKTSWEKHLILEYLPATAGISFTGRRVLLVSSVDRYGMAEAFTEAGAITLFGDFYFALGMPIPMHRLATVRVLAACLLPVITRLPFQWLYPTGEKQERVTPKYPRLFEWAEVIAGDFHFIRRYMPESLAGKTILTQTITADDTKALRHRGVRRLITAAPEMDGRSFATNVLEGIVVALSGRRTDTMAPAEIIGWLERAGVRPRVETLTPDRDAGTAS